MLTPYNFITTGEQRLNHLDVLCAVVNIGNVHWVVIVAFLRLRIIVYIDPKGDTDTRGYSRAFERYLREELNDHSPPDSWTYQTWTRSPFRTTQIDSKYHSLSGCYLTTIPRSHHSYFNISMLQNRHAESIAALSSSASWQTSH